MRGIVVIIILIVIIGGFAVSEMRRSRRLRRVSQSWDKTNDAVRKHNHRLP